MSFFYKEEVSRLFQIDRKKKKLRKSDSFYATNARSFLPENKDRQVAAFTQLMSSKDRKDNL